MAYFSNVSCYLLWRMMNTEKLFNNLCLLKPSVWWLPPFLCIHAVEYSGVNRLLLFDPYSVFSPSCFHCFPWQSIFIILQFCLLPLALLHFQFGYLLPFIVLKDFSLGCPDMALYKKCPPGVEMSDCIPLSSGKAHWRLEVQSCGTGCSLSAQAPLDWYYFPRRCLLGFWRCALESKTSGSVSPATAASKWKKQMFLSRLDAHPDPLVGRLGISKFFYYFIYWMYVSTL